MDLALSFTRSKNEGFIKEYYSIITELKDGKGVNKAIQNVEEQTDEKLNLDRSCTSKRVAKSLAMVFNKGTKNKDAYYKL